MILHGKSHSRLNVPFCVLLFLMGNETADSHRTPDYTPSLLSGTEHYNSCKVGTLGQDLPWQGRAAALLSGEDLSNLIPRLYIPTGNEVSASLECIIYIGDIFASGKFFVLYTCKLV